MIPYILADNKISFVIENKPVTINNKHHRYFEIINAVKQADWDSIKALVNDNVVNKINNTPELVIDKGHVKYKEYKLPNVLESKLISLYEGGFDFKYLLNFIDNLFLNPSYKTIQELYSFLEYGQLPITEDGCFLAYKKVNPDFTSIHDCKTKNDIGTVVKLDRNLCDDNSSNTCSTGLHFCSYDYLQHFGNDDSKVLILKINPSKVVSVPQDYNNTKGRACEYLVLAEYGSSQLPADAVDTTKYGLKDIQTDALDKDEYLMGYNFGYKRSSIDLSIESASFVKGYRDGRGHKSKHKFN